MKLLATLGQFRKVESFPRMEPFPLTTVLGDPLPISIGGRSSGFRLVSAIGTMIGFPDDVTSCDSRVLRTVIALIGDS